MATSTTIEVLDATRPYIVYRPPTPPTFSGTRAVYLYTDGESPDAFWSAINLGRQFAAFAPAATIALSLGFGPTLTQYSTSEEIRAAYERAVTKFGWTREEFVPS
jgi:hypothetical protein